jgi:GNAT superfamily N-acetyltransferase
VEPIVNRLAPDDETVAPELVRLINRAYAAGEAGLWREELGRTDETEIAEAIRAGQMLVAAAGDRIVGCLRTRALDASTADIGLIGVDPEAWGGGIGRALVDAAENLARARGATTMQLELLVPRTGTHPDKKRLRNWYTRRGYAVVRRIPFEDFVPHAAPLLSAPGDILVFTKPLAPPRKGAWPPYAAAR